MSAMMNEAAVRAGALGTMVMTPEPPTAFLHRFTVVFDDPQSPRVVGSEVHDEVTVWAIDQEYAAEALRSNRPGSVIIGVIGAR